MLTKEITKGSRVKLANGWEAETLESARKSAVLCKVFGYETECGSVYGHDIVGVQVDGAWVPVTGYQPCQIKCKELNARMPW